MSMITLPLHQQEQDHHQLGDVVYLPNPSVSPFNFLEDVEEDVQDTILIMLNQKWASVEEEEEDSESYYTKRFENLWRRSAFKACVDGGLLTLHCVNEARQASGNHIYCPDLVSGDFDSVDPKMLDYYRKLGSKVEHTPDQNETDFTKCLALISSMLENKEIDNCESVKNIVALSGASVRFDHSLSNVNTLFKSLSLLQNTVKLFMLSEDTCMTVINKGRTQVDLKPRWRGGWCSILPVGSPLNVLTRGLEFDLNQCNLRAGKQIMKFNRSSKLNDGFVVCTDHSLVLVMEIIT